MEECVNKDAKYNEFFLTVDAILRKNPITQEQKWQAKDFDLSNFLE